MFAAASGCFNLVDLILLNPFGILADFGVDSGNIVLAAADTPADNSGQVPRTAGLAHQRATAVTLKRIQSNSLMIFLNIFIEINEIYLASIFAFFTSGAHESGMQFEFVSETSAAQFVLAVKVADNGHVHFLQNVLVLAAVTERVLAPSGDPAALTNELLEPRRQASRAEVRAKIFKKKMSLTIISS